jgi:hypothetical protein
MQVSQKELVSITRLVTQNSHDQFRESKQIDKSVVDLATRAFSKEVRNLLVKILNEANEQVREAHESPLGKALLDGRETLPFELSIGSMDLAIMDLIWTLLCRETCLRDVDKSLIDSQSLC